MTVPALPRGGVGRSINHGQDRFTVQRDEGGVLEFGAGLRDCARRDDRGEVQEQFIPELVQMSLDRLGGFLQDEEHDQIKGQRPATCEVGGARTMARDKFLVAQALAQRGDELRKIFWNGNKRQSHPKGNREAFRTVQV